RHRAFVRRDTGSTGSAPRDAVREPRREDRSPECGGPPARAAAGRRNSVTSSSTAETSPVGTDAADSPQDVTTTEKAAAKTTASKKAPAKKAAARKAPASKPAPRKTAAKKAAAKAVESEVEALAEVEDSEAKKPDSATDAKVEASGGFVYNAAVDDAPAQQVVTAGATADPVKDYLKQIGKVALLNAAQEVELAERIEAGLYAEHKLK